ncbi:MAG: hypothetical protein V1743_02810 [Nanoarchaeota archaeon]
MAFSKTFPKTIEGSNYPKWEEVFLSAAEDAQTEKECRDENVRLMQECIADAKQIIHETGLKPFQTNIIHIAISLFEKRASHEVYWKEEKAKDKFDEKNRK